MWHADVYWTVILHTCQLVPFFARNVVGCVRNNPTKQREWFISAKPTVFQHKGLDSSYVVPQNHYFVVPFVPLFESSPEQSGRCVQHAAGRSWIPSPQRQNFFSWGFSLPGAGWVLSVGGDPRTLMASAWMRTQQKKFLR